MGRAIRKVFNWSPEESPRGLSLLTASDRHLKRSELNVCYYVGPRRHLQELHSYDVVVTTYATLLRERTKGFKREDKLLRHNWLRVVFDEGMFASHCNDYEQTLT